MVTSSIKMLVRLSQITATNLFSVSNQIYPVRTLGDIIEIASAQTEHLLFHEDEY